MMRPWSSVRTPAPNSFFKNKFQIRVSALGRGLTRIAQETRRYYLLGYVSTNTRRDGDWRKIDVKVARADVEVRARKGYYAPGGGKKGGQAAAGWRPGLQQALDSPFEFQAIPVRLTHHVFGEGDEKARRVPG